MWCHARAKHSANVGVGLGQVSSASNQPLNGPVRSNGKVLDAPEERMR